MRDIRLRRGDGVDFARLQVDAMAQHGLRRQQAALLIDIRVIARRHMKVAHFFNLLAVLREMRLEIGVQPLRQFGGAAHQFFRAGHRETRAERIFEPAVIGAMPFPAKPFAFDEGNRKDFLGLELAVGPKVHHHFAQDHAQPALRRRFEANVATVLVNGCIDHRGRRAAPGQFLEEKRCFLPRFGPGEFALDRKNVLAQPGQQLAFASGDGRVLGQVGVAIDQPGENRHRVPGRSSVTGVARCRLRKSS